MTDSTKKGPERRVFISYSWSSPEHEKWVLDLATELVHSGIDVALDKWNLREGQDKFAFMEQMVTSPDIHKVLAICDRKYSLKADGREGGVGVETQIISKEVYDRTDQTKFVAIIAELDEDGRPTVPVFLKSRIYVDMSNPELRACNFEQLVRCIFDRPLHRKPPLGKVPRFIAESGETASATTMLCRRAIDSAAAGRTNASGIFSDYLDAFHTNLERYRLVTSSTEPFDEIVFRSLESMLEIRDEFLNALMAFCRHVDSDDIYNALHRFLESSVSYKHPPLTETTWRDDHLDNYGFFLNELFLYIVAVLLRMRRFARAHFFMESSYYVSLEVARARGRGVRSFDVFWHHPNSFEARNKRLNLRRLSVLADTFKQRATRADITFENVMEADFVLFLWGIVQLRNIHGWFPSTLLYASHHWNPFEIFERATSRKYFENVRILLGVDSRDDLLKRYHETVGNQSFRHIWQFEGFDPPVLMNAEKLETAL